MTSLPNPSTGFVAFVSVADSAVISEPVEAAIDCDAPIVTIWLVSRVAGFEAVDVAALGKPPLPLLLGAKIN